MDSELEKKMLDYYSNSGFMLPSLKLDTPLYRYRGNLKYAIDEIETGNIFLAPIDSLNDPFEATCILTLDEVENSKQSISSFWIECYFLHCFKWSNSVRNALQDQGDEEVSLREFADRVSALVNKNNNYYPSDEIVNLYYKLCSCIRNQRRQYGNVASFSERNDSPSMWAYYADSHKGVCFKYDFSLLDSEIRENQNILNSIHKVWYSDLRHTDDNKSFSPFFKSQSWAHEQEWRLFREFGKNVINVPCITEVYLGINFDVDYLDRIIEAIIKSGKHIEVFALIPSRTEYTFEKIRINFDELISSH